MTRALAPRPAPSGPRPAGVSVPCSAAAPPNGAGFDGVASVSAPGPIASTWLVAEAVWPAAGDRQRHGVRAGACIGVARRHAGSPSGRRRSPTRSVSPELSRVASTAIVSGVLPFGTDVVNDALTVLWRLETAWATPTSASRLATTSAAILVRVTALRYAPDARSPSRSPRRRRELYFTKQRGEQREQVVRRVHADARQDRAGAGVEPASSTPSTKSAANARGSRCAAAKIAPVANGVNAPTRGAQRGGERAAEEQLLRERADHDERRPRSPRGRSSPRRRPGTCAASGPGCVAPCSSGSSAAAATRPSTSTTTREPDRAARGCRASGARAPGAARPALRPTAIRRRAPRRRRCRRGSSTGRTGSGSREPVPLQDRRRSPPAMSSTSDVRAANAMSTRLIGIAGRSRLELRPPPVDRAAPAPRRATGRVLPVPPSPARSTRIARRPAAVAPSPSLTGSSPDVHALVRRERQPLERDLERSRIGLRRPDSGRVDDRPRSASARPSRREHGRQRHVPVRHDREAPTLRRQRRERGRRVGNAVNDDRVGQARQELGAVGAGREHVGEHVGALEPQRRQRRIVARPGAVRRVVPHLGPHRRPRSGRATRRARRRARSEACRRGAGGSRRTSVPSASSSTAADHEHRLGVQEARDQLERAVGVLVRLDEAVVEDQHPAAAGSRPGSSMPWRFRSTVSVILARALERVHVGVRASQALRRRRAAAPGCSDEPCRRRRG